MKYLAIHNDGEIDINALMLMGASTKGDDPSKIGFFGSGNKYAIATLLRKGYALKIFSGLQEIVISTRDISFGDLSFKQILVNDQPTSLTTRMGPEWQVWFALREFVCNAIDEGGYQLNIGYFPQEGKTLVCIECRDEVEEFATNIGKYILEKEPLFETKYPRCGRVAIHKKNEPQLNIYRKGISVIGGYNYRSLFDYDLDILEINESRIIQYLSRAIEGAYVALARAPEEIVRVFLENEDKGLFEAMFDSWEGQQFSEAWHILLKAKHIYPENLISVVAPEDLREDAIILQPSLAIALKESFPDLVVFGKYGGGWVDAEPSELGRENVKKALEELKSFGILISNEIKFGKSPVVNITAEYNNKSGVIILSVDHLDDYNYLVMVIMEENYHVMGYGDGSRSFEQRLMGDIISLNRRLKDSSFGLEK